MLSTPCKLTLAAQCSTLRELVDDLDWAGAPVCISMRSEPPALSFAAHGQIVGDLKVCVCSDAYGAYERRSP